VILYQIKYQSPIGELLIAADENNLLLLKFLRTDKIENFINSKFSNYKIYRKKNEILDKTTSQLSEYFSGKRTEFNIPLNFIYGTKFQVDVWKKLRSIKFGETASYLDIARLINNPFSYRAVGNANNKNPISIIIPCHRVLANDGKIGGYGGGINSKQFLLDIEKKYPLGK
tara:strand:- start:31 stop:543 length:513 start_codon:yes stop_codon:yes gene_type:complete